MTISSGQTDQAYWRSLDELADSPEFRRFVEAEFPSVASQFSGSKATRRQFLKLMGASLALGGLAGCRWPKETIVPATRQPGDRIPGVPVQYATAMELGGVATGLLVTSYDGRPIKIEGNEKHPFSRGKTNAWMQASVLELYDPDRSQQVVQRMAGPEGGRTAYRTWDEFTDFARRHFDELRAKDGTGLAVLSEPSSSPSSADMRARFLRAFPQAQWYEYEPLARDHESAGARAAFERPVRTHLHLEKTDVLVSFDDDFLLLHPAAVKYAGDFAARRRADDGTMNRLYVFESNLTVTGSMADQRYAVRASDIPAVAEQLLAELSGPIPLLAAPGALQPAEGPLPREPLAALARDLAAHQGRAAILVGPRQPPEVHWLGHYLNFVLGNVGRTITYSGAAEQGRDRPEVGAPSPTGSLADLAAQMDAGAVETLVILGGNPAHTAPGQLPLGPAFGRTLPAPKPRRVKTAIHLGLYDDETASYCDWHVPQAHYLESWGDARAYDGTVSIVQPLIDPLYGGKTVLEMLALFSGDELKSGYDITRRTFRDQFAAGGDFEPQWRQALHDGIAADTQWPPYHPPQVKTWKPSERPPTPAGFELVFTPDYSVYDGRFGNNAWLQELPDPITKLTWDNAALISPADAKKLGIEKYGDMLRIEVGARPSRSHTAGGTPALQGPNAGETPALQVLEIPAYILPGHAEGSLTLPLGYGRTSAGGKVAAGTGFDVNKLRSSTSPWIVTGAKVTATGKHYPLATTQDHHAIRSQIGDDETQARVPLLVREATLAEYKEHPDTVQHVVHLPQLQPLWQEKEYKDHKWGMAIDLSACTGCSACIVACQAENNVPVVGKDEVARGREMHWIRVDRYFREARRQEGTQARRHAGTAAETGGVTEDSRAIEVVHQPVACVHCENAPCEQVCPVAATVHDEEGLNVMVYNRCVGTRYCSNNCPFKVRRFNWFYNHHGPRHPRSIRAKEPPVSPLVSHAPGRLQQAELSDIEKLVNNPNVTVRSRGVMEKCTYCVQRINAVKIQAKNERWDRIPDGLITPACAQACPTDAIVFGDLNDPASRVRKLHEHNRAYALLAELNIKPRTKYLAKLRNPAGPEPAQSDKVTK